MRIFRHLPCADLKVSMSMNVMFFGFVAQAGIALGELKSLGDLYDFNSMATLFLIGVLSVTPTLISKKKV